MSFQATLNAGALARALAPAARLVPRVHTIPILGNVMLRAVGGRLQVVANNLDQAVQTTVADSDAAGDVTAPGQQLAAVVGTLAGDGDVTLKVESGGLVGRQGKTRFKLGTLPGADFPPAFTVRNPVAFQCAGEPMAQAFREAAPFASSEITRAYLNGVYLDAAGGRLVATDGHCLAVRPLDFMEPSPKIEGAIVPREILSEIVTLLQRADIAKVAVSDAHVSFDVGQVQLVSKLVDGHFPPWQRIVPRDPSTTCLVPVAPLSLALDRNRAADHSSVQIDLDRTIRVRSHGRGASGDVQSDCHDEFDSEGLTGNPVSFAVNIGYLRRLVASLPGAAALRVSTSDSASPVRVEAVDGLEGNIRVVMPVRL